MTDPRNTKGEPPTHIHIEKKKVNWLAWAALLLGLLALLLALSRCDRRAPVVAAAPAAVPAVAVERVTLPSGKSVDLAPATLNYELHRYLASNQPAPRSFTFDKLNFDTASSTVRADDQPTLAALVQILAAYPKAVVKLVGYADSRGAAGANEKLGEQRAAAVAKSLIDGGIDAKRISTASGGDTNPVGSNATAGGQFENRRTELVVTAK